MGTNEQHLANNNPAVQGSSLNYQNWAGPSNDFDIQAPLDTVWKFEDFSASHILRENDLMENIPSHRTLSKIS